MNSNKFIKIWFESKIHGQTAGLVVGKQWLERSTLSDVSRLFPYSEANKLVKFCRSPEFVSFEQALLFQKPEVKK